MSTFETASFDGQEFTESEDGRRTIFSEESGVGNEGELYIPYSAEQKLGQFVTNHEYKENAES
jgi:hypothetical protein